MNNSDRAERGQQTLEFYESLPDTDPECPQDLIADLLHYLHTCGHTLEDCKVLTNSGFKHFEEELDE